MPVRSKPFCRILILLAPIVCPSCHRESPPPTPVNVPVAAVRQAWSSTGCEYNETDSVAACQMTDGSVRVFATSKKGDRLDVFDGMTGAYMRSLGKAGTGEGEFARPNGVAVVDWAVTGSRGSEAETPPAPRAMILVVERGNARVQAFWVDNEAPAGTFAQGDLEKPYGIAISDHEAQPIAFVTDMEGPAEERVRAYRLSVVDNRIRAALVRSIGDPSGPGEIIKPESIAVDDRLGRLLICDEVPSRRNVKVYDLDGKFTGRVFGAEYVHREPEGIVVYEAGDSGDGFVVLTDQQLDVTNWHIFDRRDYRHLGAFTGEPRIANTDGICLFNTPFDGFPSGAMFAVNNDQELRAYSFADIISVARPVASHAALSVPERTE